MFRSFFLLAGLGALAACGGNGVSQSQEMIVEACRSDGAPEAVCDCAAEAMADNLGPELLAGAASAMSEGMPQNEWMDSLSDADRADAEKANEAVSACLG
jgi:hypothetical protein